MRALTESPVTDDIVCAEVRFRLPSWVMVDMVMWTNVAPRARRNISGKNPILEERRTWRGRQAARTKAIPEAMPVRRACRRRKARANVTREMPPNSGPRPNKRETRKPDASSGLQSKGMYC